jgi:hypothetical protein
MAVDSHSFWRTLEFSSKQYKQLPTGTVETFACALVVNLLASPNLTPVTAGVISPGTIAAGVGD